ncbi:MAG: dethiobiotin synthase [Deltaproteobacteria bacterium]|nr:dethiobiotin synthase [Candidatus Anaeroferrophillus wilburensis]MBN2889447.1 dethiobiotin synthase [Deltaproteobacteria bacterium]
MNKSRGLFITGTDTGVGKTLVSAILAVFLRHQGRAFSYLKPMESGIADQDALAHDSDGSQVRQAAALQTPLSEIIPFTFREPLAPLLAARRQQQVISRETLRTTSQTHLERHPFTLVEGAGGLLVPLCPQYLVVDLIQDLQLPVLLVCRSALGGVNHTLLSLACLRQAGIPIAGLVVNHLNGPPGIAEQHFSAQIEEFDPVPILGELPFQPAISFTSEALLPLAAQLNLDHFFTQLIG